MNCLRRSISTNFNKRYLVWDHQGKIKKLLKKVVITIMVGKTGFEPATPWSQTKCSTKLSHFPKNGALEGIRTPDLLVRSQTLYPTELRAHGYVNNI